jgi:hypothetical protein
MEEMPPSSRVRRVRLWLVVAGALVASGCAAITGLDQYVKGSADASSDAVADQTVGDVGTPDAPTADSSNDSSPPDAAGDTSTDAPVQDGGSDADDAGDGDAGCGPVNTITNCSACGAQCDTSNASNTSCTGTTCQYTCKTGFSNCDAAAPDLNGCECPTPVCCGAGCATTHACGVNNLPYYDCVDAGTYNQTQAAKACTAYTNDQFACNAGTCNNDAGDPLICGAPDGGGCACWAYGGTGSGHVHLSGNASCFCPSVNDPSWN